MGSGKSTVSRRFQEHGAMLIDGDALGWEVLERAEVKEALAICFGPGVLSADGSVDRRALGKRVFADPSAMAALNAIVQPVLVARVREVLAGIRGDVVAVLDAAMLTVWRLEPEMDGVVEVSAPAELRLSRLRASKGFSEAEARERVGGQSLPKVRNARRHWSIENTGTPAELLAKADRVWLQVSQLRGNSRTGSRST
jgi:dephospho-CoA kinase